MENRLAVVVPCYNEESVLNETTKRLSQVLEDLVREHLIAYDSYILFVNDGSKDKTWPLISQLHSFNENVCGVNLAGNVGHQNALWAGYSVAVKNADMIVSIDADLQDDVNAIREMVIKHNEGNDIVYGVRNSRVTDTWFKRTTALSFYRLMKLYVGEKGIVYNHADYRLMSKRALAFLLQFRERNLFLRGMVPLVGYNTACVYYERKERFAGESKYPLSKMINFAVDGITSFSIKPVRMVLYLGLLFLLISLGILCWVLFAYTQGIVVPGWSSLMLSIWFCSGCVLFGLGVVGEYIGKIYVEVKNRPRYNIERTLLHDNDKNNKRA
jgi:glycosyltransferase involved in cell wall biosynthesis